MANDGGLNTNEVQELHDSLPEGEEKRYLARVLAHRGVRLASVSSHEIVAGNPDAYSERTVEQQADQAIGRPHEPVSPEDLNVRGSAPAGGDAKKSAAAKK